MGMYKVENCYRTIYGTYIDSEPVGFCKFGGHRGCITKNIYKNKGCDGCSHFRKNEKHPAWKSKHPFKQTKRNQKKKKQKIFY